MGKSIDTEKVGGGLTNPSTKATAYDDSGDKVAESYAEGQDAESQAEALADVQDKLAEKREEDSDS